MALRGIRGAAISLLVAAAGLVGCRSAPILTPQQVAGKQVYDVACAHCHEKNDLHLKKAPPNLHGLFNRSTLPNGAQATDAEVEHLIMTGKGTMPSFAYQMSREQMTALLAYLHTGMRDERNPLERRPSEYTPQSR